MVALLGLAIFASVFLVLFVIGDELKALLRAKASKTKAETAMIRKVHELPGQEDK